MGGTPVIGASGGPIARASMARVGTATVLTALCGYAVLYLAARDLEPAGFSVFAVFWGAFGLVTGAANGLLQESTREVRAAGYETDPKVERKSCRPAHPPTAGRRDARDRRGPVVAASSPLWSGRVFAEAHWLSVGLLSAGWPGSACTPRCWACSPGSTIGPSTGR